MRTYRSARLHGLVLIAFFFPLTLQMAQADSATWNLNPLTGDWNTAANWMPNTIPNGPTDVATFDVSNTTDVFISSTIEVRDIVFNSGASPFTITINPLSIVTILRSITNDSGVVQNFAAGSSPDQHSVLMIQGATLGDLLTFTINSGGDVYFNADASAGGSTFAVNGTTGSQPVVNFVGHSTAGGGTFSTSGLGLIQFSGDATAGDGTFTNSDGGFTFFYDTATAGNATVINNGADLENSVGSVIFGGESTAGNATVFSHGGTVAGRPGGFIEFLDNADAGNGTFVCDGGVVNGAGGSSFDFLEHSSAGNSTIIINGGQNGGEGSLLKFTAGPDGGTARLEVFGNGSLDISTHKRPGMATGSIEGDGLVYLGANNLSVGSNNLLVEFSGVAQDGGSHNEAGGSLTKVGDGAFVLSGANTYTGGTTVPSGILVVSNTTGSGTGTGEVLVSSGTLSGGGVIAGEVTVGTGSGTGAFLAPAFRPHKQKILTLQSGLTLAADSTYTCTFTTSRFNPHSDQVIANGVSIDNALLELQATSNGRLRRGTVFTIISNTTANAIAGNFSNLPDGSTITVGNNNFQASYSGGDGNDLTLTVVP